MKNEDLKDTLVIPTLNEYEAMKEIMPFIKKEWYDELIVVDGGSTDATVDYCRGNGYPVIIQEGKGLPLALCKAFKLFKNDILITFSPDGNSIPELIPPLVEKMREGYDMVIVSRYLESATSHDDGFLTGIGNKMFIILTNFLFRGRYTDVFVIFRAYSRDALNKMALDRQESENWLRRKWFYINSWELASSIRAAKLKLAVAEIPGDEPKRIGGQAKVSIVKNGSGGLLQLIYEFCIGCSFVKHYEKQEQEL